MRVLTLVEPALLRSREQWKIPPPPPRPVECWFEGEPILREVRDPLALLLCLRYRDALLWMEASPQYRDRLFRDAGSVLVDVPPEAFGDPDWTPLIEPLAILNALVTNPGTAQAGRIAAAAGALAVWAGEARHFKTQKLFAELGAYIDETSGEAARVAGVICRNGGELERARVWLRRGVGISRTAGDWKAYVNAQISRGNLEASRKDPREARRRFRRAINAALTHNERELAGAAWHNLLILATDFGTLNEVLHHATEALACYGHWNEYIPQLVHDTAYAWAMYGYNEAALELFDAVEPHIHTETERILLAASVGRASGFLGNGDRYAAALDTVLAYVSAEAPRSADVLVLMAQGALALGNRRLAVSLARQGGELAAPDSEHFGLQDAAGVLEAARTRRKPARNRVLRPQDEVLFQRLLSRLAKVAVQG